MTRADIPRRSADGGFTLIEVLVALVLSSLLMMAVGGLFLFTRQLGDRVKIAGEIERAVLNLRAASSLLNLWSTGRSPSVLDGIAPDHFALAKVPFVEGQGLEANVALKRGGGSGAGALEVGRFGDAQSSSVDLSVFDEARIEYLVATVQGVDWAAPDQLAPGKTMAARLSLTKAARRWYVILWMENGR